MSQAHNPSVKHPDVDPARPNPVQPSGDQEAQHIPFPPAPEPKPPHATDEPNGGMPPEPDKRRPPPEG